MKYKISIIIPIFNEEKNIIILLKKIIKCIKNKYIYEIIIVDDLSTDNSKKKIESFIKKKKKIIYIIRKNKRDLSQSCAAGFEKSKFQNILVMDGDLQHDPFYIPKLINKLVKNNYDIVVGARNFRNKNITTNLGVIRLFFSRLLIKVVRIFLGELTSDPMSGFFVFKKKIYTNNKNKLYLYGYKILLDLIYNIKKLKISDINIKFKKRKSGNSKMNYKIVYILIKFLIIKWIKKY